MVTRIGFGGSSGSAVYTAAAVGNVVVGKKGTVFIGRYIAHAKTDHKPEDDNSVGDVDKQCDFKHRVNTVSGTEGDDQHQNSAVRFYLFAVAEQGFQHCFCHCDGKHHEQEKTDKTVADDNGHQSIVKIGIFQTAEIFFAVIDDICLSDSHDRKFCEQTERLFPDYKSAAVDVFVLVGKGCFLFVVGAYDNFTVG